MNGQRPDANYFMVDGVSANLGNAGGGGLLYQGGAGQFPSTNALGGMSNLVSLDALEEFRIQTSTFAPEYGRTPGAQVSVVTKSGTNSFHGSAFEYFRNDKLDANDWFANAKGLPRPELRQNDFGGVLGGPIRKDKLFFFGSYEGLRVRQPHVAQHLRSLARLAPERAIRRSAAAERVPAAERSPISATERRDSQPATPIRRRSIPAASGWTICRRSESRSSGGAARALENQSARGAARSEYSNIKNSKYGTQVLTLGSNQALTPQLTNEVRVNYSRVTAHGFYTLDNFGGATPPPDSVCILRSPRRRIQSFFFNADSTPNGIRFQQGKLGNDWQRQVNVTDNFSRIVGTHQMKFGVDYRRITSKTGLYRVSHRRLHFRLWPTCSPTPCRRLAVISRNNDMQIAFTNCQHLRARYVEADARLTITYGLRWEYNAAPSSPNGTLPFTVTQVDNLATMTVAPQGTPLWHPQKDNFAPRLGIAWQARPNLVLRAGAGIFYDLGYADVADGHGSWPYAQQKVLTNLPFPLSAANAAPPPFLHHAAGRLYGGGRSESRFAQNL